MTDIANITVPADAELSVIVVAAGGSPATARYDDGTLYVPGVSQQALAAALAANDPARATKARLVAYAATKRFEVETGGVEVGGVQVRTDRESQALVAGAFNLVQVKPNATIRFKGATGFVTLDATAVQIVAATVGEHVQACFAKEAEVADAIEAGSVASTSAIDAAFATL